MLYYKGDADLNQSRIVGIVGTRSATAYGKAVTQELIRDLTEQGLLVVSGLAFGIDASAHRGALDAGLQTIGVLGHGLDRIYPFTHKSLAERIISQGGLLTEFMSGVKPSRENFPRRNRIIAGLCDAIVVVEAARKGGALITAELANSYNRDVFAIPGRVHDPYSEGANHLIRTNKAALIQGAADLVYLMGWKRDTGESNTVQKKIFLELSREEEIIVKLLQEKGQVGIDDLCTGSGLQQNQVSSALLNLEFEGVLKCLPGKVYTLL
jgi:DNA processing protein